MILSKSKEILNFFAGVKKRGKQVLIITDENVEKIYRNFLQKLNFKIFIIKEGERSKSRKTKAEIEDYLLDHGYLTNTELIAFGGGVVSDLTGFIASTYMRGISFSIIPTTVIALVDASVGGKNGINTTAGKNVIGTFYPPESVCLEEVFLKTLEPKLYIEQFSEVVKITLTLSSDLYFQKDKPLIEIRALKEEVVLKEPKDQGVRQVLNFGHTFAHAYEKVLKYKISHGLAVWIGIYFETFLSYQLGYLPKEQWRIIQNDFLDRKIDFSINKKATTKKLYQAMLLDKKNKTKEPHFVLLIEIGKVYSLNNQFCHRVSKKDILKNLSNFKKGQLCDV